MAEASSSSKRVPLGVRDPSHRTITNPVAKDSVKFIKFAVETDHAYTEVQTTINVGGGVPMHYHGNIVETFTAGPKGLGIDLNGKRIILKPNEAATVQIGELHRFFNHSDEQIWFTGRIEGQRGFSSEEFEKSLHIMYGLARDGFADAHGVPTSPLHLAIIGQLGDTTLEGWGFWLATPIFKGLYWYARWSGEEERLLKKYFYGEES